MVEKFGLASVMQTTGAQGLGPNPAPSPLAAAANQQRVPLTRAMELPRAAGRLSPAVQGAATDATPTWLAVLQESRARGPSPRKNAIAALAIDQVLASLPS
jgi:hypothetical protein